MSDVTLIGLGAMGSALAKALIGAGHSITVWNRSPERLDNIAALGAQGASGVLEAVKSSNVILVCVSNYTVTRNFLGTKNVLPHLRGKTLVQMGTGTPSEARDNEAWMKSHERLAQYDRAVQPGVGGLVDVAHAPRAQGGVDLVGAE